MGFRPTASESRFPTFRPSSRTYQFLVQILLKIMNFGTMASESRFPGFRHASRTYRFPVQILLRITDFGIVASESRCPEVLGSAASLMWAFSRPTTPKTAKTLRTLRPSEQKVWRTAHKCPHYNSNAHITVGTWRLRTVMWAFEF